MKKSLISKAIALALVVCGTTAQAVVIDVNGGGGSGALAFDPLTSAVGAAGSAVRDVTFLDWKPDNAIAIGALSTPTRGQGGPFVAGQASNESYLRNVAQGSLGLFGTTLGDLAVGFTGMEFTFVASFYTFTSGIGSGTVSNRLAPGDSYFRVYADSSKNSNVIAGTGYDDGTLILEGTLSQLTGNFTDQTRRAPTPGNPNPLFGQTSLLDGYDENGSAPGNVDYQNGVRSHIGNGSNSLTVDVTSLDSNYFLGNIAQLLLTLNYSDTTNLATPFISTTPSNSVVGVVPAYSVTPTGLVNGADCGPTTGGATENGTSVARCDFHFQSDASGSFVERRLPEPASLALVGLAFAGAGVAARRRAKKA